MTLTYSCPTCSLPCPFCMTPDPIVSTCPFCDKPTQDAPMELDHDGLATSVSRDVCEDCEYQCVIVPHTDWGREPIHYFAHWVGPYHLTLSSLIGENAFFEIEHKTHGSLHRLLLPHLPADFFDLKTVEQIEAFLSSSGAH